MSHNSQALIGRVVFPLGAACATSFTCAATLAFLPGCTQRVVPPEPVVNLEMLVNSSRAHVGAANSPKVARFPPATAWTPPLENMRRVCAGSARERARGTSRNDSDWNTETWRALGFAPEFHLFSYRYESWGTGIGAKFRVTARGDANCDGVPVEYSVSGELGPVGVQAGEIVANPDWEYVNVPARTGCAR